MIECGGSGIFAGMGHVSGLHGFGWFFQLLILITFFLVVYWVLKGNKTTSSVNQILKERYAKGELSEKEFLKLKRELK